MTSSVMRRSEGLQLCDARFEKVDFFLYGSVILIILSEVWVENCKYWTLILCLQLYEQYDEENLGEGAIEADIEPAVGLEPDCDQVKALVDEYVDKIMDEKCVLLLYFVRQRLLERWVFVTHIA